MFRPYPGRRAAAIFLWGALCLSVLAGCAGPRTGPGVSGSAAGAGSADSATGSASSAAGSASSAAGDASAAGSGSASPEPAASQEPEEPPVPAYDFSRPAPETEPVENDYFTDAAFVGDSRTDGFLVYSGIGHGENLTSNGLSIFKLAEKKVLTIGGEKYTLLEALGMKQYGKVYLSLGVNELGYDDDEGFYRSYCQAIDVIRALQPQAVIYLEGLIPVNEEVIAETTGRTYLTNAHLRVYNDLMRQAAEEKQVVFLDLYSDFVDENGELPAEASRDGVHLYKKWCQQWLDYLKRHTVEYGDLYPGGAAVPEPAAPEEVLLPGDASEQAGTAQTAPAPSEGETENVTVEGDAEP